MFSEQTYEIMKERILSKFPLMLDKREGSYSDSLISPLVEELAKAYMSMGDILSLGFIETNFDTFLDKRVSEFGVYRKQGTKATGEVIVTGSDGTAISNGTLLIVNDLKYVVLNDVQLPIENILYVEALEVGERYNILTGTELKLIESNSNITNLVAHSDFKNGLDIETDEDLRKRFVKVVNNPSTSGNKAHYEEWALEVQGVGNAKVYPLWNGNGTVKVLITDSNNKQVTEDVINNCKYHIEECMPIGCQLTVSTPTNLDVAVVASIELKYGYSVEEVKEEFNAALTNYLKNIEGELVYSKVYGILVNLAGIGDIVSLTLNGSSSNITVLDDKIVNIISVDFSEVV